jgi:uncharacterized FlgJ-related protein
MKNLNLWLYAASALLLIFLTSSKQPAPEAPAVKITKQIEPKQPAIFAGRTDKEPTTERYKCGLPVGRNWLSRSEWKGQNLNKTEKACFKKWKQNYIKQFIKYFGAEVQKEVKNPKFKSIPASLVIAQAIIESQFNTSKLSKTANNIFGHKYRKPKKGKNPFIGIDEKRPFVIACDDSPKDKFRNYKNQWYCIRAHSYILLRYAKRIKGRPNLQKFLTALCGADNTKDSKKYVSEGGTVYATSCLKGKCYSQKLKEIIDFYNLEKFDR